MNLLVITLALAASPQGAPTCAAPTFEVRESVLTLPTARPHPPKAVADGSVRIPPKAAVADGAVRIPPKASRGRRLASASPPRPWPMVRPYPPKAVADGSSAFPPRQWWPTAAVRRSPQGPWPTARPHPAEGGGRWRVRIPPKGCRLGLLARV